MPKGEPITSSAMDTFRASRDRALQELSTRTAEHAAPTPVPTPPKKDHD
jgi:hypothetical protein